MPKDEKPLIINIRKLSVNYELRYDYSPMVNAFISNLPREHKKVRKDSVIDTISGQPKDEWVRSIREVEMGKVISFFLDNSIQFQFQNVPQSDIDGLVAQYKERQKRLAEILKLKGDKLVVDDKPWSFMKIQPRVYQKQAVMFAEINNGNMMLGDQMGIGKSLSAFAYAAKHNYKTLIITPSSAKNSWKNEIMEFTNEKTFIFNQKPKAGQKLFTKQESLFNISNYDSIGSYIEIEYKHRCSGKILKIGGGQSSCTFEVINTSKTVKDESKEKKEKTAGKKKKVLSQCPNCKNTGTIKTTVHGLKFIKDNYGETINPIDYDLIVLDEFHRIKNKKTTWSQLITMAFRDVIPRKILLSGTAIKNRPFELFVPLNFLNPQEWNNQHEFGVRYCAGFESNFGWKYDGISNSEELYERMSGIFLRRLKKDVLKELPEKTFTYWPIELTPEEYKEYDKILASFKKEVDGKIKEESYLVQVNRLKHFLNKCRLLRVKDYLQDTVDSEEKIVVMNDLQDTCNATFDLFPGIAVKHMGGISDDKKWEAETEFKNNKKIKIFTGMFLSSGIAINLTSAGKLMTNGFPWTSTDFDQAVDRIHRQGSVHPCIQIIIPFCIGTIDEDIIEFLDVKENTVSRVLDNAPVKKKIGEDNILKALVERIKNSK